MLHSIKAKRPAKPVLIQNQVQLAKALRVTRQTVCRWLREPGNPGRRANGTYDFEAWSLWQATRREGDSPDARRLRAEQIELQNKKLSLELGILQGGYSKNEDVERWGAELGTAIKKIVLQTHNLAPQLAGLTVPEIESRLREHEHEILSQLHGLKNTKS